MGNLRERNGASIRSERHAAARVQNKDPRARRRGTNGPGPKARISERIQDISKKWDDDNRVWLEELRQAVRKQHGDSVLRMLLFGSRARGDWRDDSDVDVLVIVQDTAVSRKGKIAKLAAVLAIGKRVAPGVLVMTEAEWARLGAAMMNIYTEVEEQGVALL